VNLCGHLKAATFPLAVAAEKIGISSKPLNDVAGCPELASDTLWDEAWSVVKRLQAISGDSGGVVAADSAYESLVSGLAAGPQKRAPESTGGADNVEKSRKIMPDNADVRDLCQLLEKHLKTGKSQRQIAREFTGERPGKDRKAQSLLRQARRFRHLWERQDG
jgi:hypothetical protein